MRFVLVLFVATLLVAAVATAAAVSASTLLKHRHTVFHSDRVLRQHSSSSTKQQHNLGAAEEQWYDAQRLDHFDALTVDATWRQRYFVNTTFWKREQNGPIFLMIGAEGPLSAASVADRMVLTSYASLFGAMVASVEHRFYGKSVPTADLSTKNLKYLSSQQALADVAQFIPFLRAKYNVPEASKIVVFGGSYGGNLSGWFRYKYPHLAVGSIASSAPVLAQLNFHDYMTVVAASVGSSCNARIRQATDQLEKLMASDAGRTSINSMFKTCKPLRADANADDVAMFFSSITDPVCGVVQYSRDNVNYQPYDIDAMCQQLLSGPDALQAYVDFINAYNQKTDGCVVTNYADYIAELRDTRTYPANENAAGRAWTWQTCSEFGYYQSAEGRDQPFSSFITEKWFLQQCGHIFDTPQLPNQRVIDWSNSYYGGDRLKASNTAFVNGRVDPWHWLSIHDNASPSAPLLLMQGTAHCADLYSPSTRDLPELTATRQKIVNLIASFLA